MLHGIKQEQAERLVASPLQRHGLKGRLEEMVAELRVWSESEKDFTKTSESKGWLIHGSLMAEWGPGAVTATGSKGQLAEAGAGTLPRTQRGSVSPTSVATRRVGLRQEVSTSVEAGPPKWKRVEERPKDGKQAVVTGKNAVKAGHYNGALPCEAYQAKFRMAALANGWSPEEKAGQLAASLEGEALVDLGPEELRDFKTHSTCRRLRVLAADILHLAWQGYPDHAKRPGEGSFDPYCPTSTSLAR
ncbi:UNVERIFIED_CONTAM: hypothetical protein FKN15_050981 [Acipenser sinensis]